MLACGRRLKKKGKGFGGARETPATQASLICEKIILSHQDTSLVNTPTRKRNNP